jgi:predicted nucleotidyltransferase
MNRKEAVLKKAMALLLGYGAKRVGVFGSFARGEQRGSSDLDLLVEFAERKSLMDLVGIEQELSQALGIKVDLLTEKAISPYLIDRIKKETIEIRS